MRLGGLGGDAAAMEMRRYRTVLLRCMLLSTLLLGTLLLGTLLPLIGWRADETARGGVHSGKGHSRQQRSKSWRRMRLAEERRELPRPQRTC